MNTWAGSGRWAVSHGGVMNSNGKDTKGRPTADCMSHAFRAANGTAVFITREWTPDALESLDELRQQIGETHKQVKTLP